MAIEPIILTPEGFQNLKNKLEESRGIGRTQIQEALREARSHGDLRENAAYEEAKLNQGRLEGLIKDLEYVLEVAKIVDRPGDAHEIASMGSIVTVIDGDTDDEWSFTLVGSFEADPMNDKISILSPMGKAVISKQVGDTFTVEAPKGTHTYKITGLS